MQNAINLVPSITHSEKKLKGHFFFCRRQNYPDVEIKTSKTTCQRLFKGNLLMLFSLFHSQIEGLEMPEQPSSKQYNGQSLSLMTSLSLRLVCPNHYILGPFSCPINWGLSYFFKCT